MLSVLEQMNVLHSLFFQIHNIVLIIQELIQCNCFFVLNKTNICRSAYHYICIFGYLTLFMVVHEVFSMRVILWIRFFMLTLFL